MSDQVGIIGRERAMIDALTKTLYQSLRHPLEATKVRETRRGNYFEVLMADRRVARVEVTFDRVADVAHTHGGKTYGTIDLGRGPECAYTHCESPQTVGIAPRTTP